ncbi:hypothetical protein M9458_052151, partial [Cirrhinus mrigala]
REHAEAAFAEGGCQACKDMPLGTLHSRAAFYSKKPQLTSTASRSSPSTSGYEAAAMCVEGEREETSYVLPGISPQAARPACSLMESPDDFESSSQYVLDLLFGAPAEEKGRFCSIRGRGLDDLFLGSGRDSRPRLSPVPFFPEVHEELTKSWKAPLSARSRYTNSPSLTTLDSAKAYTASGQVASALRTIVILQVYQAKVLKDLHEGAPDPELLQELRSVTDYALRASQALGRAMSTMVVQEHHLWLNLAEMRDAEKRALAQLRRSSNPCLLHAEGGRLRKQLRPRSLPVLQLEPPNGPVLIGRWHHQPIHRLQRTLVRLQSVPETGSPGKEDRLTCSGPHSMRGRALNLTPTVVADGHHKRVRSDDLSSQGNPLLSSHGTNPPDKTASGPRGFSPPTTGRFASHSATTPGTPGVTPLRPLAENFPDWLNLPNPSRWLLRTIRLGYVIHFTSRPPMFRGVLSTFVRGKNAAVLRRAYQYKVLRFGLSLLPRVFTRVAEAALAPLREVGIRILNYLDDWLILAHLRDLVCTHRVVVVNHLAQLGLLRKEQTLPDAEYLFSLCGTGLGQYVCTSLPRARTVSAEVCGNTQMRVYDPPETNSEIPGSHGILSRGHAAGFDAHETATTLASYPSHGTGMAPRHVSCERHTIVWGAVCNGHAASRVWTGPRLHWHINCLELLTVLLALRRFRPLIQGKHVLVRSDNTATVAYINHQGSVHSFCISQLARHLLLWSQHRLGSLRATHIPSEANRVADSLSQQVSLGGEWRLHPQSVQL